MSKKERERQAYCLKIKCQTYSRCLVKWGKDCVRNSGKKIPRLGGRKKGHVIVIGGPHERTKVFYTESHDFYMTEAEDVYNYV